MPSPRFACLVIAAAIPAAALVFFTDQARACSAPCSTSKLAPATGAIIPASVPGLPVFGGAPAAGAIQLRDGAGALVAGSIQKDPSSQRSYFLPASPLAPGNYEATAKTGCNAAGFEAATFTVGAAKPLPLTTGALSVKRAFRENTQATTSAGSCTEAVDAAMVDLALDVDAALEPYAPVLSWETKVDDKWWSGQNGGIPSTSAGAALRAHGQLRLFTACDGLTPSGRFNGLAPGAHDVSVRAVLTGGARIEAATIRVNVTCGADNGTVAAIGDGESNDGGGGSDFGDTSGDSGAGGGQSPPTSSSDSTDAASPSGGDGCATASQGSRVDGSSASIPSISSAILALLGVAARRRSQAARLR